MIRTGCCGKPRAHFHGKSVVSLNRFLRSALAAGLCAGLSHPPAWAKESSTLPCSDGLADTEDWGPVQNFLLTPEGRTVLCEKARKLAVVQVAGRLRDPHDREDVAQDVVIDVLRSLPRYDGRIPLEHWVRVIVRRRFIDHLRKKGRRPEVSGDEEVLARIPLRELDDVSDEDRAIVAAFVAFMRDEVTDLLDRARRAGETEQARRARRTRGHVLEAYLGGTRNVDIAAQTGIPEETVAGIVYQARLRWRESARARGLLPRGGGPLGSTLHGLFAEGASDQNGKMTAREAERVRTLFLFRFPLLDTIDAWEEIFDLPVDESTLLRRIVVGKTLGDVAAESGDELPALEARYESALDKVMEGLAERDYVKKRWLSVYRDKSFTDYLAAVAGIPALQREVLRLVARGLPHVEVARRKQLKDARRVRTLLHLLDEAIVRRLGRKVHDVAVWVGDFALRHAPGKTIDDFWKAVDQLPERNARVVRGRAEGKTNAELAQQLGIPMEQVRDDLENGRRAVLARLSPRTAQGDRWLEQYFLALHPDVDAARFWALAEAKLDPPRLRVLKMRHGGDSYEEIATRLELPSARKVMNVLATAKATLEEALFEANRAANPFKPGTREAWLWTWILYRYPSVKPEAFWPTAASKLTAPELAVVEAKAAGLSAELLAQLAGADTPKNLLTKAQKKMQTALAPRPSKQGAWVAKVLARHPERTEADFWAAVATLSEDHQRLVRTKVSGGDTKAIAAAVKIDRKKVPGLVNYVALKIDRRLAAPVLGREKWIRAFILERFPERSLADFEAALGGLTEEQRRIVALRREGKNLEETAKALAVDVVHVERVLGAAQDRLARALAPRAAFDPKRWLADNFLREAPGATEGDFRHLLERLPTDQRRTLELAWAGKSLPQIADDEKVPTARVQGRYYHGRKRVLALWREAQASTK